MINDEVLNANHPEWKAHAREFMSARKVFEVSNFVFAADGLAAQQFAEEFNYRLHLDPDRRRAILQPK